jgi:hypothetical protein
VFGNFAILNAKQIIEGRGMTGLRRELSFDFNTTSLKELSQCLFDHLALSTQAAFCLGSIYFEGFGDWFE